MPKVVVVGAGGGGLSCALELAYQGVDVTVLEAHIYPGGCAGTFYHKGYRFDAGATLAAGFAPGGILASIGQRYGIAWGAKPASIVLESHLPNGECITRWSNPQLWRQQRKAYFGEAAETFWQWQEQTAEVLWSIAQQLPPWPPFSLKDCWKLLQGQFCAEQSPFKSFGSKRMFKMIPDGLTPLRYHLNGHSFLLRDYVDGQLMIAAQTTSISSNSLFGAASLDFPHQGVGHIEGGIGAIASKMVEALNVSGVPVLFRKEVSGIIRKGKAIRGVHTKSGEEFECDVVVFNLPKSNIHRILQHPFGSKKGGQLYLPNDGWGAFTVYVAVDENAVSHLQALNHQISRNNTFCEGNSIFLSLNPSWDNQRRPKGARLMTLSTHTDFERWRNIYKLNIDSYKKEKKKMTECMLQLAQSIIPELDHAKKLVFSGTPVSFQRFTRRESGWVGGFPQTHLFRFQNPRIQNNVWMVGDSIFPGQSLPAVVLGGQRVASEVLSMLKER